MFTTHSGIDANDSAKTGSEVENMSEKINYKDSVVYFSEHNGHWSINPHNCFCCNKLVRSGKAILVINNGKYIPNILLHTECFSRWEGNEPELISDIEKVWKEFQELNKIFNRY